jgi:putative tricarboxylic transport membrane protein
MDSRHDIIVAIGVVLLGVLVIALTWNTTTPIVKDPVGPRFFPFVLGLLFIVGGSVVAIQRFRSMNAEGGYRVEPEGSAEDDPTLPASAKRALAMLGLTVAYAFLFQPLGFLISTPIYIVAAFAVMSERRYVTTSIWAAIYTIATYLLFAVLLEIRFPLGPLAPLLR